MLKTITKKDFLSVANKNRKNTAYLLHCSRWKYYKFVINMIQEHKWESCLEAGPYICPVMTNSDIIDYKNHGIKLKYKHDIKNIPWPIQDKYYDLFLALQVWEHLDGEQDRCFSEVIRTSKNAIFSFPYMWKDIGSKSHRGINKKDISSWTMGYKPEIIKLIKTKHMKKNTVRNIIVYFFRFD